MVKVFKKDEYYFEDHTFCFDFAKHALKLFRRLEDNFRIRINREIEVAVTSYVHDSNGNISRVAGGYLVRFNTIRPYKVLDKLFIDYSVFNYYYYKSVFKLREATFNFVSGQLRGRIENGEIYVYNRDGIREYLEKETLFDIYFALTRHRYYKNQGWLVTKDGFYKDGFKVDELDFIVFGDSNLFRLEDIFEESTFSGVKTNREEKDFSVISEFGNVE